MNRIAAVILVLVVSLALLEIGLRLAGFTPYRLPEFSMTSEPDWCFEKDSLGITLKPGEYQVNLNNGLIYNATHTQIGTRSTGGNLADTLPKLFVYGCSYTYGQGVNDEHTYPYVLQTVLDSISVVNYAHPGYGTLQAVLQLEKSVANGNVPQTVVLGHAPFHEERNLLSRSYKEKLYIGYKLLDVDEDKMVYPRFDLNDSESGIKYENVLETYNPFPLRNTFALINLIDGVYTHSHSSTNRFTATNGLISRLNNVCKEHGIRLIIADVEWGGPSYPVEEFCAENEIEYVNISPNFNEEGYRNLPFDMHPNEKAHKVYAIKLLDYLSSTSER